jgi:hypothetical protein
MPNDQLGSARFSLSPVQGGGPFLVSDEDKGKRLVASRPKMDLAMMVAAPMKGSPQAAIDRRRATIAILERGLQRPR